MEFVEIDQSNYGQVKEIYDAGIRTGIATFEPAAPDWSKWNKKFLPDCRLALLDKDQVIGWAALTRVSQREVYKGVAEVSLYIDPGHRGKSLGKRMLTELIKRSEKAGLWTLQASIFKLNTASIKLHQSCGFRSIGYRERIAERDGVWHDTIIMERRSEVV